MGYDNGYRMTAEERHAALEAISDDIQRAQTTLDLGDIPVGEYEGMVSGFRVAQDLTAYYITWDIDLDGEDVSFEARQGIASEMGRKMSGRELRLLGCTSRLSALDDGRWEQHIGGVLAKLRITERPGQDGRIWHDCKVLGSIGRAAVQQPAKPAAVVPAAPAAAPRKAAAKKSASAHPAVEPAVVYAAASQADGGDVEDSDIDDGEIPF